MDNPSSPEQNLLDDQRIYGTYDSTPVMNETDPIINTAEVYHLHTSKDNLLSLEEPLPDDPPIVLHSHPPPLSFIRLLGITISLGGLQFGWALQIALLSPFMLLLGLPKPLVTLVWLCGPIAGLIMQPLAGAVSDTCNTPFGKRRPFLFLGTISILISMIIIPWCLDLGFLFGGSMYYQGFAIAIATVGFWILDFSSNLYQGPARFLLADLAPIEQQNMGNAMFSTWLAFGSIIGSLVGYIPFSDVPFISAILSSHVCSAPCVNLKVCFFLAMIFLTTCTIIAMIAAKEKRVKKSVVVSNKETLKRRSFKTKLIENPLVRLVITIFRLPLAMRRICTVQFFSWVGWFAFLVFISDWMAESVLEGNPTFPAWSEKFKLYAEGIRYGSFGLAGFSVVSFLFSPLCPFAIKLLGYKTTWLIGQICLMTLLAIAPLVGMLHNKYIGCILISCFGIPWSVTLTVPFPLVNIVAPDNAKGTYFGILNIFVVIPQLCLSAISPIILYFFKKQDAVLLFGSVAVLISCFCIPYLKIPKVMYKNQSQPVLVASAH